MRNCGYCGKPIHHPGIQICEGCKKARSKSRGRLVERENKKAERQDKLFETIAKGGEEEEEDKYSLDFWGLEEEHDKYRKRGRRR